MHWFNFFRIVVHIWVMHGFLRRRKPSVPSLYESTFWCGPCKVQEWICECGKSYSVWED